MASILDFTVIDVETANSSGGLRWSICQVGVAVVESGKIAREWSQLIDPRINDWEWSRYNVKIHGISPADVRGKPTFRDIYPEIKKSVAGGRIVSHYSPFDENVIRQACERHRLPMLKNEWRDSIAIAKRAWEREPNYKLSEIARRKRIRYNPHDAGEDARAAAELVLKAAAKIGAQEVNNWLRGR